MRINVCLLYNEMRHQNKRDAGFLPKSYAVWDMLLNP